MATKNRVANVKWQKCRLTGICSTIGSSLAMVPALSQEFVMLTKDWNNSAQKYPHVVPISWMGRREGSEKEETVNKYSNEASRVTHEFGRSCSVWMCNVHVEVDEVKWCENHQWIFNLKASLAHSFFFSSSFLFDSFYRFPQQRKGSIIIGTWSIDSRGEIKERSGDGGQMNKNRLLQEQKAKHQ